MACIKWPQPFACLFWEKCHPSKALPQKKSWQELQNRPSFLPTTKPHPLNVLIEGPPPLYWLGTSKWCFSPCVSSIILCICLPRHSYCSCLISFYYACWACAYLPRCEGCVGFWARIASLAFLMDWVLSGQKFLPFTKLYFCNSFSCYAHGTASCHFCHVGPLGLLPLFLGFLGPFTLSLPLIVPMSLLAFIFAMLAHWVYYLFSWVSSAHLFCLYLLLCP